MHLRHVRSLEIGDVVLAADALGGGAVGGGDEAVARRTLVEAWQGVKNGTVTVVQQEDAEAAAEVLVPQGVLVVEETEVADDAEDTPVSNQREAGGGGEGALDAVDAAVAVDGVAGVGVGQTDGGGVGVVDGGPPPGLIPAEAPTRSLSEGRSLR